MGLFAASATTAKSQLTINDLDDDSLGMIFNKLPYIDRMRIERVCQRWYSVSKANWCIYSKRLTIGMDEDILKKILRRSGPYFEEIIFSFYGFPMGTIKWIAKLCPNLKRMDTSMLMLNADDWLACSSLEAFSLSYPAEKGEGLDVLFRSNKRLRRLKFFCTYWLTASDFHHLDPGQLEFLHIVNCENFKLTAKVADKLAESLVELSYKTVNYPRLNLQHFSKLKNLRSLSLIVAIDQCVVNFIRDIAKNFRKLECLFLVISSHRSDYYPNVFETVFDLPCLSQLVITVSTNVMPRDEILNLLQRAPVPVTFHRLRGGIGFRLSAGRK